MRRRRRLGWVLGCSLGGAVVLASAWPGAQPLRRPGPMNVGHEHLECGSCHRVNYYSHKNKKKLKARLELKKFCEWCEKHAPHKETK